MNNEPFMSATTLGFKSFNNLPNFKRLYTAANDDEIKNFFKDLSILRRKEMLLSWLRNNCRPISEIDRLLDTTLYNRLALMCYYTSAAANNASASLTVFKLPSVMYGLHKVINDLIVTEVKDRWNDIKSNWDTDIRKESYADIIRSVAAVEDDAIVTNTAKENGLKLSATVNAILDFVFKFDPVLDWSGDPITDMDYHTAVLDDFEHRHVLFRDRMELEYFKTCTENVTYGITHNALSDNPSFETICISD